MFAVFENNREIVTSKEMWKKYPNKAYVLINCTETTRHEYDDIVHTGYKGELYAITDNNEKDIKQFNKLLASQNLKDKEIFIGDTFTTMEYNMI